jgi:hypothetical protein
MKESSDLNINGATMTIAKPYLVIVAVSCLLTACIAHEGIYSPACVAFAGDKIELHSGQFAWQKFTDSVDLDDNDEVVNPFPGYPMRGRYRINGQTVTIEPPTGEATINMYLHPDHERLYLLTAEQHRSWEQTGSYGDCPLVLGGSAGN